jgi:hypothetical protein
LWHRLKQDTTSLSEPAQRGRLAAQAFEGIKNDEVPSVRLIAVTFVMAPAALFAYPWVNSFWCDNLGLECLSIPKTPSGGSRETPPSQAQSKYELRLDTRSHDAAT